MTRYTAQTIEQTIRGAARIRIYQKKTGKSDYANDAGYWEGGRCNWGGTHNLAEDCERLAQFFTGITELKKSRQQLIQFNNQQEFDDNKRDLLTKTTEAINGLQMKTSNSTSIAGVCCIWSDFEEQFKSILDDFRKDLELLKKNIENVLYNEAKELQRLNIEERELKNQIEENERKARNELDDNKRKQFTLLVDEAKEDLKKLLERKSQLKTARLGDNFNPDQHIDDFLKAIENKLSGKNRPTRPTRTSNPQQQSTSFDNSAGSSNTNPSTSYSNYSPNSNSNNNESKPLQEKYWKELLFGGAFLLGVYYILNQNDHE